MSLTPLAGAGACTAVMALLVSIDSRAPITPWLGPLMLGILVAGAILALDDPAHDLLAAVPVHQGQRLTHRLALLVPLVAASVVALTRLVALLEVDSDLATMVGVALASVGLLTNVTWSRRRPESAATAGAALPLAWVVWATVTPSGQPFASLAHLIIRHPEPLVAAALPSVAAAFALRRLAPLPRPADGWR